MFPGIVGLPILYVWAKIGKGMYDDEGWEGALFVSFFGFVISFLIWGLTLLAANEIVFAVYDDEAKVYISSEKPIKSLRVTGETYGSFFLGCGELNGKQVYYTYVEEDGVHYLKDYETKKLGIKEVENITQAYIETSQPRFESKFMKWMFGLDHATGDWKYVAHVPTGTIISEYKVQ